MTPAPFEDTPVLAGTRQHELHLLPAGLADGHRHLQYRNPHNSIFHRLDRLDPQNALALAALSEFGGGLAWVLGLLVPLASLGMAFTMAVAVYSHAVLWGHPFVASGGGPSYEIALIYLCISLLFMALGPGRLSLDRVIFGERQR